MTSQYQHSFIGGRSPPPDMGGSMETPTTEEDLIVPPEIAALIEEVVINKKARHELVLNGEDGPKLLPMLSKVTHQAVACGIWKATRDETGRVVHVDETPTIEYPPLINKELQQEIDRVIASLYDEDSEDDSETYDDFYRYPNRCYSTGFDLESAGELAKTSMLPRFLPYDPRYQLTDSDWTELLELAEGKTSLPMMYNSQDASINVRWTGQALEHGYLYGEV